MTRPSGAGVKVAVIDVYLARGRLRAEVPMLGFNRLSDLFNNAPGEFIGANMRLAALTPERRDLVIRLRDVRLVRPIDELPSPIAVAASRDRVPARVVLDLDDWQVTGDISLVDRVPWLDFMVAARNRFISVSRASVRFVGVAEPMECEYVLVNGARVSALYEAP